MGHSELVPVFASEESALIFRAPVTRHDPSGNAIERLFPRLVRNSEARSKSFRRTPASPGRKDENHQQNRRDTAGCGGSQCGQVHVLINVSGASDAHRD
jgi:hypothetical protein